jgi:hypothetical protein
MKRYFLHWDITQGRILPSLGYYSRDERIFPSLGYYSRDERILPSLGCYSRDERILPSLGYYSREDTSFIGMLLKGGYFLSHYTP